MCITGLNKGSVLLQIAKPKKARLVLMWSALDTLAMIIQINFWGMKRYESDQKRKYMSKYLRWCSGNGSKELNWSQDETYDLIVGGYIIWMQMFFPLSIGAFIHHN